MPFYDDLYQIQLVCDVRTVYVYSFMHSLHKRTHTHAPIYTPTPRLIYLFYLLCLLKYMFVTLAFAC